MHQTLNPSGEKFCGDQRYIRLSLMENCEVGGRVGPADHILECRAARNQSYRVGCHGPREGGLAEGVPLG